MERATRERLTGAVILVAALAILVPEMLSGPGEDDLAREPVADTGPPLTTYDLAIDPAAAPSASRQQQLSGVASQAEAIAEAVPPPVIEPPASQAEAAAAPPGPADGGAEAVEPAATPPVPQSVAARGNEDKGNEQAKPAGSAAAAKPAGSTAAQARAPVAQARPSTSTSTTAAANAAGGWWVQLGSFSSSQNAQGLARKLRARGFDIEVSVVRSGGRDLHRVRAGPEKDRAAATALRSRLAAAGEQGTLVAP